MCRGGDDSTRCVDGSKASTLPDLYDSTPKAIVLTDPEWDRSVVAPWAGEVWAVDEVIGVRSIGAETLSALPPLFTAASETLAAIAALDGELTIVLRSAALIPDEAWVAIEAESRL